ncbi:Putative uncharacterized protein [Moritella viscosa]|nr:Putative uncharacterized protein [Moritella viscosa]
MLDNLQFRLKDLLYLHQYLTDSKRYAHNIMFIQLILFL